ncbi:MAG: hypothetical protein M3P43_05695 [Actinomycetota bacterium]|nr:hypothetical protein [Actinomycetota bacterium]
MGIVSDRPRLVSRIEVEARAFRNADSMTRQLCFGHVLGLLDAGATLGLWTRRDSARISDAVYYGASPRMVRGMLRRLR